MFGFMSDLVEVAADKLVETVEDAAGAAVGIVEGTTEIVLGDGDVDTIKGLISDGYTLTSIAESTGVALDVIEIIADR